MAKVTGLRASIEDGKVRQPRPTRARMDELGLRIGELETELANEQCSRRAYMDQRDEARASQKALTEARRRAHSLTADLRRALHRESQSEQPEPDSECPEFRGHTIEMDPGPPEAAGVLLGRLLEVLTAAATYDWEDPESDSIARRRGW